MSNNNETSSFIYEYRCTECDTRYLSRYRGDTLHRPDTPECVECGAPPPFRRVFSVSIHRPMMAHFNAGVGQEISDMGQYKNILRKMSDEQSIKANQAVDLQPIDPSDTKALGVTEEGLDHTNRARRAAGHRTIDLTKIV